MTDVLDQEEIDALLGGATGDIDDDDDDVLDPAELEMLNEEAERMKGIGNRHMANQVRRHFRRVLIVL